jgi:tripartite-type tricarboxylate transporter receptor subunit TctC
VSGKHLTNASPSRRRLAKAALALGLAGLAGAGLAQPTWPAKPIRLVVGFAPGGATDAMARIIANSLSGSLGQSVVVDNRPGASGNIGASEVVRARADGYTLLFAPTTVQTANPSLFKAAFNPATDLAPVGAIGRTRMYIVARNSLEAKDAKELVTMAKANPDKLSYASSGAGTAPHLAGELFKQQTGTVITHVPYRGSGPALQDVLAGQVDFVFDPGVAFQHVRSGRAKMLAVVSADRSPFFPEVPTLTELGFPGAELDIWFGVWAPKGTPAEITDRLGRELSKMLASAEVGARYGELGAEPVYMATQEFRALLDKETTLLSKLITERKIVVE